MEEVYKPRLGVLHHTNLCRPQYPSIELEPLLLRMEANAIRLVGLWRHEDGLMNIRIELLATFARVESLEPMFLQRIDQYAVRHFNAVMQRNQVRVVRLEFFGGNGAEGAVEVVDGFDEVAGEALDGEVLCGLGLALGAFL